jgi:hypothetical protein
MIRTLTVSVLVLTGVALADVYELRDKLLGSWHVEAAGTKEASTWVLQASGEGLHVANTSGAKTVVDFECKMAQECDIKDSGKRAKVTMYFNGANLVETETIGSRVLKRRFAVTGDGNTMELELIPIEPQGKTETVVFKRVQ